MAVPDPKSPNQTEQLLAEPEVQNFLTQIGHCICRAIEKQQSWQSKEEKETNQRIFEVLRMIGTHPGAIFISKLELRQPAGSQAG